MERLSAPASFSFYTFLKSGNPGSKVLNFMCATESDQKSDKIKTSILLTCIGEQGCEIYQTREFATDIDKFKLQPVLAKFENYCNPRTNTAIIHHKFFYFRRTIL